MLHRGYQLQLSLSKADSMIQTTRCHSIQADTNAGRRQDCCQPAPRRLRLALLQQLAVLAWLTLMTLLAPSPLKAATTAAPRWDALASVVFQHLGPDQGLPHPIVTALAQDASGFIWIGTQGGLARWDGYRMRVWLAKPHDPGALPDSHVQTLLPDRHGRLWVGTNGGGLAWYDAQTDRFIRIPASDISQALVLSLAEDGADGLFVGTQAGLDHIVPGKGRIAHWQHQPGVADSLPSDVVRSLLRSSDGSLWIGSRKGLMQLENGRMHALRLPLGDPAAAQPIVLSLQQSRDGRIWIGTAGQGAFVLEPVTPGRARPVKLAAHGAGGVWQTARLRALRAADGSDLSHEVVACMTETAAGQIWLGTFGQGLLQVDAATIGQPLATASAAPPGTNHASSPSNPASTSGSRTTNPATNPAPGNNEDTATTARVRRLRHDPARSSSLANDSLQTLLRDRRGALWLGGQRGVSRYEPEQQAVLTLFGGNASSNPLSDGDITGVLPLRDGRIWLGMQSKGAQIIAADANQVATVRADAALPDSRLPPVEVRQMAQTADGQVYLATSHGLYRSDASGTPVERLHFANRDPQRAAGSVLADGNRLWLGGVDGLWHIDPQSKLASRAAGAEVLTREIIEVLARGRQGEIWIGTRNHGLYRYRPGSSELATPARVLAATSQSSAASAAATASASSPVPLSEPPQLTHFGFDPNRPQGLQSAFVASILPDSRGRLWIGTQGGGVSLLAQPDAMPAQFRHFGLEQGLPNNLVDQLLEDDHGNIWASTDGGLAQIDGNSLSIRTLQRADGVHIPGYWTNSGAKTAHGELLFGGTGGLTVVRPVLLQAPGEAATVLISMLEVGGKALPVGPHNLAPATGPVLDIMPEANSITVEFSAAEFQAPERIRYAYQLEGYQNEWINSDVTRRLASWTNLPPGEYRLRLRSGNDHGKWGPERVLSLRVHGAWHQSLWARVLLVLAALWLILLLVRRRTRTLHARQHELEALVQQRTGELRQLGEIGREITANLDADIVFASLTSWVSTLLDASSLTIFRVDPEQHQLVLEIGRDNGVVIPVYTIPLDSPTSYAARVAREKSEFLLELEPQLAADSNLPGTHTMLSALFAPLIVDARLLGVMSIQSPRQKAYGERERLIFRNLTAYGAIALANAAALAKLHQAQAQLVQQEKLASLGGMVAGIAHEINTPLGTAMMAISGIGSAWRGLLDALNEGRLNRSLLENSTNEGIEYTQLAASSTARAAELISTFMSVAVRVDDDRAVELDLVQYLTEIGGMVQGRLESRGGVLELQLPASLKLTVVPEALTEALTRILANTLDHAWDGSKQAVLRITCRAMGESAVAIEVRDNGTGISQEHLARVFDPFFTTKSGVHGHVGLGLHVAYNYITQRLKGTIEVSSRAGEGTTVTIRLRNRDAVAQLL